MNEKDTYYLESVNTSTVREFTELKEHILGRSRTNKTLG